MLITLNRGRLLAPPRGGGVTWVNFYWLRAAGLSEPLPDYILFCSQIWTPSLSLLGKCNFRDINLVAFCLRILLKKPFN